LLTCVPARRPGESRFGRNVTHSQRILIVSDEALSDSVRDALEQRGFQITIAQDVEAARRELLEPGFVLAILDLINATDGFELIRLMRETPALAGILILVIADWGTGAATLALSQGADGYEPGPLEAARLLASVERLLNRLISGQAVVIE
jgi:DNA-binding response OmpR family regulator